MDLQVRRCRRASFIVGVPKIRASAPSRAASPATPVTDFSGWTVGGSGRVAEEVFRGGERACSSLPTLGDTVTMNSLERAARLPASPRRRRKSEPSPKPEPHADPEFRPQRRSVLGRPRALTEAQIATVLAWHDSRVTLKQLAASLGVSTSTVVHAIQSRGTHYKQAPPEKREATLEAHRANRRALQAEGWL